MQKAEFSIPLMGASGIVLKRFYPTPASEMFAPPTFASPGMTTVRCRLQRRRTVFELSHQEESFMKQWKPKWSDSKTEQ